MSYTPLDWDGFLEAAARIGAPFSPAQAGKARRMVELLNAYNASASLMSNAALVDVLRGHVLDSITLAPFIYSAGLHDARLVDVGTGGGFPGLVLALAYPSLRVTLMDATRRKTEYLQHAAAELGLNVEVVHARAEDAAHDRALRETFDIAVCRALGPWPVVLELTLPFCRKGGMLLGQRGTDADVEAASHTGATALLGGQVVGVERVGSEVGLENRHVITVEKVESTPPRYPRKAGIPAKRPLL
ncbi:MAG: 16S rRNA (guanine(527)-N(7))-methyltransferase RsmG [Chloroflexi bacterium]|nr:16S rRNA (guanine(527)-N(7))-methyltransferase RsmG [Chloroflexota bacterium]